MTTSATEVDTPAKEIEVTETSTRLSPETVKVGDGVTQSVGSDRYAGTVTYVSPSGKTLRFTHDEATMKPGHDIYRTSQEYDYTSVPERHWEEPFLGARTNAYQARWSTKRERFVISGSGGRALATGRRSYTDPSF